MDHVDLAKALGCYELYGADLATAWQAENIVATTTGADLVALAKQWFTSHAIGVLLPGDECPSEGAP